MTRIIRNGSAYTISNHSEVLEALPVGTYSVMVSQTGYFLERGTDLEIGTDKLYGDVLARRDRILNTYHDRPGNTGVILSGSKGSGKTLLARAVSAKAREMGMPVILVNQAHAGDGFNAFLDAFDQEFVVIFDEFEKMYAADGRGNNPQADMLSLFDGVTGTHKRLYIVTLNDIWGLSSYMMNRPGRFYYHYSYKGLEAEFVQEYVRDNLKNQDNADSVFIFASAFEDFNFDMLKAVVEEMNRYDSSARDVVGVLNANPSFDGGQKYELLTYELLDSGDLVTPEKAVLYGDPVINVLKDQIIVEVTGKNSEGDADVEHYYVKPESVVNISREGVVKYVDKKIKLSIGKVKYKQWSMADMM